MLGRELRDPLGAIRTALQVIDHAGPSSEEAARQHAIIDRQVGHLAGGKGPPANEAAGYPPRRSSTRYLGTCRTTPSSPSMSATTPTRWAGTWNPAASRY